MVLLLGRLGPALLGVLVAAALFTGIYVSETMQVPKAEAAATPGIRAQALETEDPMLYITVSQASLFTALLTALLMAAFTRKHLKAY